MSKLPYRVECNSGPNGTFEAIAAFDIDIPANEYARRCYQSAMPGAQYRVTYRGVVRWQNGIHRCARRTCSQSRERGFLFCSEHLTTEIARHA